MKKKLPNIIFIVMDTVGAKHMSLYGYPRPTTPQMERLAEASMVYDRCFAPSCWTIPSHASMFTGLYPSQHGAYEGKFSLNENIQHLVSALKMEGYRTYGISANGLVSPATGLCPDFDYFKDFGAHDYNVAWICQQSSQGIDEVSAQVSQAPSSMGKLAILVKYARETGRWSEALRKLTRSVKERTLSRLISFVRPSPSTYSSIFTERTVKLFKRTIQGNSSNGERPFFFFINFMEAHDLYRPPFKWRQFSQWNDRQINPMMQFYHLYSDANTQRLLQIYENLYDDELYYLDNIIGQIWNICSELQLDDETALIITSDHGEHFGEKGRYQHILSLYNELIWVPLIIRFPGYLSQKGVDGRLVSLTDIYSTILDLVQSPLPRPITSLSLLDNPARQEAVSHLVYPELWKSPLKAKQEICEKKGSHFSPPVFSLLTAGGMKAIENRDRSLQVFDLRKDLEEDHDLSATMPPEALENFRNIIEVFKEEVGFNEAVNERMALQKQAQSEPIC
jgi:arylsulfatase A-like enzyme